LVELDLQYFVWLIDLQFIFLALHCVKRLYSDDSSFVVVLSLADCQRIVVVHHNVMIEFAALCNTCAVVAYSEQTQRLINAWFAPSAYRQNWTRQS